MHTALMDFTRINLGDVIVSFWKVLVGVTLHAYHQRQILRTKNLSKVVVL